MSRTADPGFAGSEAQRAMARRAGTAVEWAAGHTPFLSQPHLVADLLTTLATGAGDAGT